MRECRKVGGMGGGDERNGEEEQRREKEEKEMKEERKEEERKEYEAKEKWMALPAKISPGISVSDLRCIMTSGFPKRLAV